MNFLSKLIFENHEFDNWSIHEEVHNKLSGILRSLQHKIIFSGSGKTNKMHAAKFLAKSSGKELYRVDLSALVSKYIGETEKNLEELFASAEEKSWILFFDEADALFGKRTSVRDSHDKYANQQVVYLLQRIEAYKGLAILSLNETDNIDEGLLKRIHPVVDFSF